jgi:hypothetical protein
MASVIAVKVIKWDRILYSFRQKRLYPKKNQTLDVLLSHSSLILNSRENRKMRQFKLVLAGLLMLLAGAIYLMRSAAQSLVLVIRCAFALFGIIALFGMGCVVLASLYPSTAFAEFLHWLMPPVLAVPLFFGFIVLAMMISGPKTPGQRLDAELRRQRDEERQRKVIQDQLAQRNSYKASAPW